MNIFLNRISLMLGSSLSVLAISVSSVFLFVTVSAPKLAAQATTPANNKAAVCEGIGLAGSCAQPAGSTSVDSAIKLAISVLSFVVGIAAVIMVIIGGFKYVISNGDSNSINSAKNTILYAIIGLVVAGLAQVLVRYVLSRT